VSVTAIESSYVFKGFFDVLFLFQFKNAKCNILITSSLKIHFELKVLKIFEDLELKTLYL
jgi:hypothetical protein